MFPKHIWFFLKFFEIQLFWNFFNNKNNAATQRDWMCAVYNINVRDGSEFNWPSSRWSVLLYKKIQDAYQIYK